MSNEPPYLYLTTTGWKTGNLHEIEIWFVGHEGKFYLVAERREHSHWVQNLQRHPGLSFRIDEQTYQGTGRAVDPQLEPELAKQIEALMDGKYHWSEGLIVELSPSSKP